MMKHRYVPILYAFVILQFVLLNKLGAQNYHSKIHFGAMYYQGDLSPQNMKFSFGPGNLSYGVSVGRDITDWVGVNARFMYGELSASDSSSPELSRRNRNLSFTSPIHEYGLNAEFCINKLWKGLDKYKLRLYYSIGLSLTHFNPHTEYNGQTVYLQPLGTEGQKLPGSNNKKYSLNALSRPMGFIVEFDFSKLVSVGMEVAPRKTFTDYLDDVSGNYPNIESMIEAGNLLGAKLSNRMGEIVGSNLPYIESGGSRGNSKNNDWYTFIGVFCKYTFGKINVEDIQPLSNKSSFILPFQY